MSCSLARQGMRSTMCAALLCTVAVPAYAQIAQQTDQPAVEMLRITVTGKAGLRLRW